jgi:hypothetical protein
MPDKIVFRLTLMLAPTVAYILECAVLTLLA